MEGGGRYEGNMDTSYNVQIHTYTCRPCVWKFMHGTHKYSSGEKNLNIKAYAKAHEKVMKLNLYPPYF